MAKQVIAGIVIGVVIILAFLSFSGIINITRTGIYAPTTGQVTKTEPGLFGERQTTGTETQVKSILGAPKLSASIDCDTSFSLSQGETSVVTAIISNTGNRAATGVKISFSASDLDGPEATRSLGTIEAGDSRQVSATLDTKTFTETIAYVTVSSVEGAGGSYQQRCSALD